MGRERGADATDASRQTRHTGLELMQDADGRRGSDETIRQALGSTNEPQGSGLPVLPPAVALIEIVLLVVAPGLLDYFVPGFPSLNEMQPHFYWLPVVLLSAQYGSLSGLLAAGSAILLATLLGWPEQEIGENHFSYLLRIWLQPVLWIATAVVLGQFRLRQMEKKEALSQAVGELAGQRQAIAEHARNLRARCAHLERLIATRREPEAKALLAALGRIQSDEPGIADRALHEALQLAFGECRAAIYVLEAGRLRLASRHVNGMAEYAPESIEPQEPLHRAAVGERRQLSVLTPGDEKDLAGRGLAAVPILAPDRSVSGVLLLEQAEAAEIDDGTAARLAAVAALIAMRLADGLGAAGQPRLPLTLAGPADRHGGGARRGWRHVKWRDDARRASTVRAGGRVG